MRNNKFFLVNCFIFVINLGICAYMKLGTMLVNSNGPRKSYIFLSNEISPDINDDVSLNSFCMLKFIVKTKLKYHNFIF